MARRLVGCLLALLVRGDIDYAEISFYPPPPEKCAPTEITLTFEIAGGLQHLDTVYFYLNQFTRGGCNNGNGGKISDGLVLLGAPSGNDEWQAEYYEGSVDNMYNDSYIILKAKYDVIGTAGYRHTVVIDASNDIRPNCGSPANSSNSSGSISIPSSEDMRSRSSCGKRRSTASTSAPSGGVSGRSCPQDVTSTPVSTTSAAP